jgi:hypothetical protein
MIVGLHDPTIKRKSHFIFMELSLSCPMKYHASMLPSVTTVRFSLFFSTILQRKFEENSHFYHVGTWRRIILAYFRTTFMTDASKIKDPTTQKLGMHRRQFEECQQKLKVAFLSRLIEYKKRNKPFPLPLAYAKIQDEVQSRSSVYSRFIKDVVIIPPVSASGQYRYVQGTTTVMAMFNNFITWMRLRRTPFNNIDYDKFDEHIGELLSQFRPPIKEENDPATGRKSYPVTLQPTTLAPSQSSTLAPSA